MSFKVPNQFRIREGFFASSDSEGNNGAFLLRIGGIDFQVIASDGLGWEHVSVSKVGSNKTPSWEIMCKVKELFWTDPEDCVIQYHPAASQYVNLHPGCLHLWRPTHDTFPTPPTWMVGPR